MDEEAVNVAEAKVVVFYGPLTWQNYTLAVGEGVENLKYKLMLLVEAVVSRKYKPFHISPATIRMQINVLVLRFSELFKVKVDFQQPLIRLVKYKNLVFSLITFCRQILY